MGAWSPAEWGWFGGATIVGAIGLLLLAWALLWDRSKGRRRCPECWYDMSGGGLTCPECGKTVKRERKLRRTRRRWRWAMLGFVLCIGSLALLGQGRSLQPGGWWNNAPTTLLIFAYDTRAWEEMSEEERKFQGSLAQVLHRRIGWTSRAETSRSTLPMWQQQLIAERFCERIRNDAMIREHISLNNEHILVTDSLAWSAVEPKLLELARSDDERVRKFVLVALRVSRDRVLRAVWERGPAQDRVAPLDPAWLEPANELALSSIEPSQATAQSGWGEYGIFVMCLIEPVPEDRIVRVLQTLADSEALDGRAFDSGIGIVLSQGERGRPIIESLMRGAYRRETKDAALKYLSFLQWQRQEATSEEQREIAEELTSWVEETLGDE